MPVVPDNVVNKELYSQIKQRINRQLKSKGRRWSLYASAQLVREYKKQGGKYRGKYRGNGITRWFKEDWINVCKLPKKEQCGRSTVPQNYKQMKKSFPYCRPLNKVSKFTPKTVSQYTSTQLKRMCRKKQQIKNHCK